MLDLRADPSFPSPEACHQFITSSQTLDALPLLQPLHTVMAIGIQENQSQYQFMKFLAFIKVIKISRLKKFVHFRSIRCIHLYLVHCIFQCSFETEAIPMVLLKFIKIMSGAQYVQSLLELLKQVSQIIHVFNLRERDDWVNLICFTTTVCKCRALS